MLRPAIFLATPCFGGQVMQGYMLSVCKLLQESHKGRFSLDLALLGYDALITRSRSTLVARFLDSACSHLLFIDADIVFEPEQFLRLLDFDRDFAAAMYPIKTIDWDAVPRRVVGGEKLEAAGLSYVGTLCEGDERREEDGFATAVYAGTGFQLIRRVVLERMIEAHPELHFTRIHTLAREAPRSDRLYALFDCMIDAETGEYLSEDYSFCRRWRALGGEIWLDLESRLTHIGSQHFRGDAGPRYRSADPPGEGTR